MTIRRDMRLMVLAVGLCGWLATARGAGNVVEESGEAKWYVSVSPGALVFEGDEEVESGFQLTTRLGYDYSDWWSFEASLMIAPRLDENKRFDLETGQWVSRLEETAGPGVHDTWALGLGVDGLFHFTRWERFWPYLTLGAGVTWYADELQDGRTAPALRLGCGFMYHFNDEWAVRGDLRTFPAGEDTDWNGTVDFGVRWTPGARLGPRLRAVGGPLDSDGDGLLDSYELQIKTDPFNPDTDGDGLQDGEEVNRYKTDPLNPDTDYDGLKDGEEVKKYGTDPLVRDTDKGGVADGHEVIEDNTNPLDPSDDLMLVELYIQFEYDKWDIKPQYFPELDKIVKVLKRNPDATARIEGHADRSRKSVASYNKRLSERRATAVMNYLVGQGISSRRLKAVGYGFERPKAPNDPKVGNPVNRRV
ncbi:MAG: OmpA family protein, partial [Kiritimatiellae bacterium]|nr:OmpA family protein [Kiritimatiellia bacterium]